MKRLLAGLLVLVMVFGMGGAGVAEGAGSVEKEKLLEAYASLVNAANELLGAALGAEEEKDDSQVLVPDAMEGEEDQKSQDMEPLLSGRKVRTIIRGYANAMLWMTDKRHEISIECKFDGFYSLSYYVHSTHDFEIRSFGISDVCILRFPKDMLDDYMHSIMALYYAVTLDENDEAQWSGYYVYKTFEADWRAMREKLVSLSDERKTIVICKDESIEIEISQNSTGDELSIHYTIYTIKN